MPPVFYERPVSGPPHCGLPVPLGPFCKHAWAWPCAVGQVERSTCRRGGGGGGSVVVAQWWCMGYLGAC